MFRILVVFVSEAEFRMSNVQWYIQVEVGKKAGPVSFEKIRQLVAEGKLVPETKIRSTEDGAAWTRAGDFDGLFAETKASNEPAKNQKQVDSSSIGDKNPVKDKSQASSIVIDVGGGRSKSKPAFSIDVKGSAKKDKKDPKQAEKREENITKDNTSSNNVKITLPGQSAQKPKEPSAAVQINIASKTSPEHQKETKSGDESTSITVSLDALNAKKQPDASSAAVKIDFGASKPQAAKTSDDFETKQIEEKKDSKKQDKKKKDLVSKNKPSKKRQSDQPKEIVCLRIASVAAVVLGLAAFAVFVVPATLSTTLLACLTAVLGIVLGVSIWLLASLFGKIQEMKDKVEKLSPDKIDDRNNENQVDSNAEGV